MPSVKSARSRVHEFVNPALRGLPPYIAGKPIEEVKRQFGLRHVIKLASNENPLGPSPKAMKAVARCLKSAQLYPDANHFYLKEALAKHYGMEPSCIVVGAGSNELIDLTCRVFSGGAVMAPQYSFIAYRLCALLNGLPYLETAVNPDFSVNFSALKKGLLENGPRILFFANPNNPTGFFASPSDVESMIELASREETLFVLDDAYGEYVYPVGKEPWRAWVKKYENLIVLKTFSKIYGLAGFRVGFSLSSPQIAASLQKARQPFNVSSLSLEAARVALEDRGFLRRTLSTHRRERTFVLRQAEKRGLEVVNGEGNFVLLKVPTRIGSGEDAFQSLLKKGLITRPVGNYGLSQHLRVTLGTRSENTAFFKGWDTL